MNQALDIQYKNGEEVLLIIENMIDISRKLNGSYDEIIISMIGGDLIVLQYEEKVWNEIKEAFLKYAVHPTKIKEY
jgi:hypothetical protein